jgi:Rieske Fe-S protein
MTRRQLLTRGTALGSVLIGAMLSVPAAGFLLSPLFERRRAAQWIPVGVIDAVTAGTPAYFVVDVPVDTGPVAPAIPRGVYVVRTPEGDLLILSNTCTHMQCNVHWDRGLEQFLCPCHGGLYDLRGTNVGGPPPQPLVRWVSRTTRRSDGSTLLEVQNRFSESI